MSDAWAAAVLSAGAAALVGRRQLRLYRRRQHHTSVAARRLQRQAVEELACLADRHRVLQDDIHRAFGTSAPGQADPIFGPDLIGDLYRQLIVELQIWVAEASEELEGLRGWRLKARRAELRSFRAEVRALCAEIEAREARWREKVLREAELVDGQEQQPGPPAAGETASSGVAGRGPAV